MKRYKTNILKIQFIKEVSVTFAKQISIFATFDQVLHN